MAALALTSHEYSILVNGILFLHALFISWVIFGAFLVWRRPLPRWLHVASIVWALLVEILDWPCPLTLAENWLEQKAGVEPYHGGFILHYLDKLVYPDISLLTLTIAGIIICASNLAFYLWLIWRSRRKHLYVHFKR
jgi:Protein of Unknown function (DUF2784)